VRLAAVGLPRPGDLENVGTTELIISVRLLTARNILCRSAYGDSGQRPAFECVLGEAQSCDAGGDFHKPESRDRRSVGLPRAVPLSGRVGRVTVPTMFVWSDGDKYILRKAADSCDQYGSGDYRFEILHGVSHTSALSATCGAEVITDRYAFGGSRARCRRGWGRASVG
jgi:pimeloyl-ACP methyl ester carboxylesterase